MGDPIVLLLWGPHHFDGAFFMPVKKPQIHWGTLGFSHNNLSIRRAKEDRIVCFFGFWLNFNFDLISECHTPPRWVGDDHITWPKLTGKNDEVKYWGMRLLKNNSHIFVFTFCGLGFLLYVYINKQKHHIKMKKFTTLEDQVFDIVESKSNIEMAWINARHIAKICGFIGFQTTTTEVEMILGKLLFQEKIIMMFDDNGDELFFIA